MISRERNALACKCSTMRGRTMLSATNPYKLSVLMPEPIRWYGFWRARRNRVLVARNTARSTGRRNHGKPNRPVRLAKLDHRPSATALEWSVKIILSGVTGPALLPNSWLTRRICRPGKGTSLWIERLSKGWNSEKDFRWKRENRSRPRCEDANFSRERRCCCSAPQRFALRPSPGNCPGPRMREARLPGPSLAPGNFSPAKKAVPWRPSPIA